VTAARSYKTDAIVLRARSLGEADKIFTLFTRERGKIDAVGKGVRRAQSRLGGRLEFGCEAALTMHRGRSLDVVTGAELVRSRFLALAAPGAYATAHVIVELVDAFCEPDHPEPEIYRLLGGALDAACASGGPAAVVPRFELRLLGALGVGPADAACVRCEGDLPVAWADPEAGGLACAACRPYRADALALDAREVAQFRALGAARGAGAGTAASLGTARAVESFVTHHLGRRPRAFRLLEELSAPPRPAAPP